MPIASKAVFLSYASEDAETAGRIAEYLRGAGIEVWFDKSELRGGDAWDRQIREQIKECGIFVPLISANTDARSEGYFRREWNLAVNRMLDMADDQPFLMPVVIDDTPEAAARVPDRFCERQWTRLPGGTAAAGFAERLVRLLSDTGETKRTARISAGTPHASDAARSFGLHPDRAEVPWIAVLPFKTQGSDPELAAFADGLGEDITTGLSRFPHLFVVSRNSAMHYAGRALDVRAVGRELGARYAIEGAVRRAGGVVRVSVQLLDAATGTNMWAESYDRDLGGARIFNIQDDVTDRVVATVADLYGVLVRSMARVVRDWPVEELSAKELVLRVCAYWHQLRPDEHARMRTALERILEREPTHAELWAWLSHLYSNEHAFRLNPLPDSLERARKAAERAVAIDPTCQVGWEALAEASYFARDLEAFRDAAERAMTLNPRNTSTVALMGVLISHSGEWERGCEITRRAMALNPHHAGWYHFPEFFDHYRKGEFDRALETAKRLNMPDDFWVHAVIAAASGRLGGKDEARAALESLRRLLPGYRDELEPTLRLWIIDAALVEQVMEGIAQGEALVGPTPDQAETS